MNYQDRLRGYEADKKHLLQAAINLTATDFAEKLKALRDKWRV